MHQRGKQAAGRSSSAPLRGGRGCTEQRRRSATPDSEDKDHSAAVEKAATQAACPYSPTVAPGCRLCRKTWKPDSLGCSMEGTRGLPRTSL